MRTLRRRVDASGATPPTPVVPDDLDGFLRLLASLLTSNSPDGIFAEGARLLASVAGADAAALFFHEGGRTAAEVWHPDDAATRARFGPLFRQAAHQALQGGTVSAITWQSAETEERTARAFPLSVHGRVLGAACVDWTADEMHSGVRKESILASVLEMVACKTAALRSASEAEALRAQYERWFKTLDGQLRVLDRERQKFAAMVNQTDIAIFVADVERNVSWTNQVLTAWVPPEEGEPNLLGKSCRDVCRLTFGECETCPVVRVFEGNAIAHEERRQPRPAGVRNLYVTALPIRGPDGRPAEAMVLVQDLTDLQILRRSEARYRLLFERSADAIVMAEPTTQRIVLANSMASQLLGYSVEEFEDLRLSNLHPPTEWARLREHYAAVLSGRTQQSLECPIRTRDGRDLVANVCGTLFDLDGKQVGMIEFRDVTTIRCLQAELAKADKLITLGTMNAGIAHEFKNRLAPLRGFAELLTLREPSADRIRSYAPLVVREVDRLSSLVKDVLDYARPQEPRRTPVDLAELMRGFLAEFRSEMRAILEARGIETSMDRADEEAVTVALDGEQMRRVFLNLFKNSIDAFETAGTIRIWIEREGEHAKVAIQDTGAGIAEANLLRVFDPFFSTKGVRGTGLGMCIVKTLVEANGGTIRIESRVGVGTNVTLSFPLLEEQRNAA